MRIPEPLVAPGVAVVEIHEGAGASHCGGGHQPRRADGSAATTPSSTENHRDEEYPSARAGDDDRERPFARIDGLSCFSRNDAFQAAWHRDELFRWRVPHQSRSVRRGTPVGEKRIEDLRANRQALRPPRYTGPPPRRPRRRGHCCQRCTTATHIVPASLRTSGPRSMRRPHAGGCLTRDHPEERTLLARNSDHCDAVPLAAASRNARPQSELPTPLSLPERGTTRPHPSRDRPVSNNAFAFGTTSWNHAFEERPLPAARSHLCTPEQRSVTSRSRARGAGRRWLASPRLRKSLGLAAPVWHIKLLL
jgi:hypothetical protein